MHRPALFLALCLPWFACSEPKADDDDDGGSVGDGDADDTAGDATDPEPLIGAHGGTLVYIAAGTFDMGCEAGEPDCGTDSSPPMPVTLTRGYYIGQTEVTQAEFEGMMGYDGSYYRNCDVCPSERMTWHDAAAFANAVSEVEGLPQCYTCSGGGAGLECTVAVEPYSCEGYRLPTEAEWEHAARCGTDLPFAGSTVADDVAWYRYNIDNQTWPVAQKAPNDCGLYDMSGNVTEWTQDWYGAEYYTPDGRTDPRGEDTGSEFVIRGGSHTDDETRLRVHRRNRMGPGEGWSTIGMRLVRTAP